MIHLGGEHIIRPRVDFEVAVERLIDHQRFAGFRVRGDSEYLIQLVLKVQSIFHRPEFFLNPFIFPPILYFYYNREEGKEKSTPAIRCALFLMVNAKTFRNYEKSLYLRIMVDLKGDRTLDLSDANRTLSQTGATSPNIGVKKSVLSKLN